jgi:hypothetical protein
MNAWLLFKLTCILVGTTGLLWTWLDTGRLPAHDVTVSLLIILTPWILRAFTQFKGQQELTRNEKMKQQIVLLIGLSIAELNVVLTPYFIFHSSLRRAVSDAGIILLGCMVLQLFAISSILNLKKSKRNNFSSEPSDTSPSG